ncbi:MAG TPA: energy transducer TonB [Candidatus Acidoferrales bacterium]|nr:energy transducer TonB [Candidatus Acidoferrales bacterium]
MKQIGRASVAAILLVVALCCASFVGAQKQSPDDLISKARNAVSPSLMGPHHLEAQVTVVTGEKKDKGTYVLDWAATDRFREEIHLPGYDEIKVVSGTTLYRKRSADYIPARVFQLEELMNPTAALDQFQRNVARLMDDAKSDPPHGEPAVVPPLTASRNRIGKNEAECIALGLTIPQECVDAKHGWPLEVTEDMPDIDETLEFSDYSSIGGAHVSRRRRYLENGVVIIEAQIKKLFPVSQFDASTFAAPADAQQAAWCSGMMPPLREAIKAPASVSEDDFPETEVLYGLVGADGTLRRYNVIESAGPKADAAMQTLADSIHFVPATCGGKPVVSETKFAVSDMDFLPPVAEASVPVAGKDGFGNPTCQLCPVPPYTHDGFEAGIQGAVVLSAVIGQDGRAHYVRILKRLGHGLDEHAARYVKNTWRLIPARGPDGKPTAVRMMVKVKYDLGSSSSSHSA